MAQYSVTILFTRLLPACAHARAISWRYSLEFAFDITDAHATFEVAHNPYHGAPLTKDLWYCAYAG